MENTYEGYWYRSHQDSASVWQYGLYKKGEYHPNIVYDDDDVKEESHVDDRVAGKGNEKLLSESEITTGIKEFLEVGMKYKINIETKENKYLLRIEHI
jgi:hypothetical protein